MEKGVGLWKYSIFLFYFIIIVIIIIIIIILFYFFFQGGGGIGARQFCTELGLAPESLHAKHKNLNIIWKFKRNTFFKKSLIILFSGK